MDRTLFFIGLVVIFGMCLVPPWHVEGENLHADATASTHQFKTAGNGGASYSDRDIQARVRPVKGTEEVSGSIVPVAGDWNQFPINNE